MCRLLPLLHKDVSVAAAAAWRDAVAFTTALAGGQTDEAFALLDGELLPGLHVDDVPVFERWRDDTQTRLRRKTVDAARALALPAIALPAIALPAIALSATALPAIVPAPRLASPEASRRWAALLQQIFAVMDYTEHHVLVGDGARQFARDGIHRRRRSQHRVESNGADRRIPPTREQDPGNAATHTQQLRLLERDREVRGLAARLRMVDDGRNREVSFCGTINGNGISPKGEI